MAMSAIVTSVAIDCGLDKSVSESRARENGDVITYAVGKWSVTALGAAFVDASWTAGTRPDNPITPAESARGSQYRFGIKLAGGLGPVEGLNP